MSFTIAVGVYLLVATEIGDDRETAATAFVLAFKC